ncbi:glycosyltransferase [Exilibacterium tricleocarpae]|uniref:Glycosyltransferase n=1 Tax=Exilibacterium tricleocarpae TaxID=2591008 RepID=A0A545T1T7_9GAMM|nr:glycosyltransferase [Exilibacterium tricleocarpae]TQV71159.1 glycosyltransferase [Exilibacterium tricleocarpae]
MVNQSMDKAGESYGISVIVPTYNKVELLKRTIDSLLKQTLAAECYEIIVVDDGSNDSTGEAVKQYQAVHSNIKYLYTPDDGFRVSRARNIGIAAAAKEILLLLDSGILAGSRLLETHLIKHYEKFDSVIVGLSHGVEEVALSASDTIVELLQQQTVDKALDIMTDIPEVQDCRYDYFKMRNFDIAGFPIPWIIFWAGHVSLRRRAADRLNGFDEWFTSWGGEDVEFGYRLHQAGHEFVMLDQVLSIHYPHHKNTPHKTSSSSDNLKYMIDKHRDRWMTKLLTGSWMSVCESALAETEKHIG